MEAFFDSLSFPREYLRAALLVSLLSVWLLVVLFYYLNRYTKRDYFTVWTAAWLFYALWLTLNLRLEAEVPGHLRFDLAQCCVAVSSVFLFWGSLRFLEMAVRQTLVGLFLVFVLVWTLTGPRLAAGPLQVQLPVFFLLGAGSLFAGVSFFRVRRRLPFVGAGMLALGFMLWGLYLVTYPLSRQHENLISAGYLVAAVLQLFIAVSMIVLVLEEVRMRAEQALAEIVAVRSEKESLERKVLSAEETCRNLYDVVQVTEGKQKAYEELRRTQAVVVRQERLRAIGQMASGLVHDMNNLLTPIIGYCDLILNSPNPSYASARLHVSRIRKAAHDIARIVARMRSFYRPRSQDDRLETTFVNQVVAEVVELTRPRWRDLPLRDGIVVDVCQELSPGLPPLFCDASELRQALTNLLFNAVDALPKGGKVTITSRAVDLPPAGPGGPPTPAIQLQVEDNGVGMDEETRQHCIEPFFSTKAERGGTGLGLAMVYGMVQRQNGDLDIESNPGAGTRLRLTLPVHPPPKCDTQPAATAGGHEVRATARRILYIDDEEMVRDVIGDCLRFMKHEVRVAASGEQGLELFRAALQRNQPFDVVITDLGMPRSNGKEVARKIKEIQPDTPVVVLTGWHHTSAVASAYHDQHVDVVLGKPPDLKHLAAALAQLTYPRVSGRRPETAPLVGAAGEPLLANLAA